MNALQPKVLLEGLVFPEGPRWRDGKLWFSDMFSYRVMTVDLEGRSEVLLTLDGDRPSGLGFLPDGRLLIVSMERGLLLRLDPAGPTTVAELKGVPCDSINDMVVDSQGRAYIGSRLGPARGPGAEFYIVLAEPNRPPRIVARDLQFPNGCVITPDGKTFIVAETRVDKLTAFDIARDGSLFNRRLWAEVPDPDGICLDAEGAIWVGSPGKREFVRVLQGGQITHRIKMPEGIMAIACMLGGEGRRTLFLTTSAPPKDNTNAAAQDLGQSRTVPAHIYARNKGCIEMVTVDVPGAGWP